MQRGLTLLEVLLTAIIAVTLLGLTAQGIMRGSDITRLVTAQQELLEDVRSAGGFLADRLAQAVYVYPPGVRITLGQATDYWAINPKSGLNSWEVGTDPMVAFILAPEDSSLRDRCSLTPPLDPKGCLRFVAFYALKRSGVIEKAPSSIRPETNPKSDNDWVLYYFSCPMVDAGCGGPQNTPPDILGSSQNMPTSFAGTTGQFLADYINPAAWNATYKCAMRGSIATLDDDCQDAQGSLLPIHTAATIEFTLQSRITRGGHTTLVPSPPLTIKSSARNLLLP
jgi:hypothetical protein